MTRLSFKAIVARGAKAPPRVMLTATLVALAATMPLGVVLYWISGVSIYALVIFMGAVQLLATYRIAGSMDHGSSNGPTDQGHI